MLRCGYMHYAIATLFLLIAAPAFAASSTEDEATRQESEVLRLLNEDKEERTSLHDDIFDDVTTGTASDTHENCREVTVRYRLSDGRIETRNVDRCR
jgi:hypothetical protein